LADAQKAADRITRKDGIPTIVTETPDGFVVSTRTDAQPVRNPDGTPLLFDSERAADRFIDTNRFAQGRLLDAVQIRINGAAKFAVLEGATSRELDAIKSRPDAVNLGRGQDRSAAGALQDDVAKQAFLRQQSMARIGQVITRSIKGMTELEPHEVSALNALNQKAAAFDASTGKATAGERTFQRAADVSREIDELQKEVDNRMALGEVGEEEAKYLKEADVGIAQANDRARSFELVASCMAAV
jgi:hypothetical protein